MGNRCEVVIETFRNDTRIGFFYAINIYFEGIVATFRPNERVYSFPTTFDAANRLKFVMVVRFFGIFYSILKDISVSGEYWFKFRIIE